MPGPGRQRKVALLGTVKSTLAHAPWSDPSWEFWANSSAYNYCPEGRLDMLLELHPKFCFTEKRKNGFKDYFAFLQRCRIPVLMKEAYEAVPSSVRYPLEQVRTEFPGCHFGSQTAFGIALALVQGVTDLGFWGVEYGHDTERNDGQDRRTQRENCLMWIGIAIGRGVRMHIPPGCHLLDQPAYKDGGMDYAVDLSPEQYEKDKLRFAEASKVTRFQPAGLVPLRTPADFKAAAEIRAKKSPQFVKEAEAFSDEVIPDEYRTQRNDGTAGLPADAGLPQDGAGSEGAARPPCGDGEVRAVDVVRVAKPRRGGVASG